MTVAAFLTQSLPMVLIAAVSPVLVLNASRVIEAAGILAGFSIAGGAAFCLVGLGIRMLMVVLVAAPAWLPIGPSVVDPEHSRLGPKTRRKVQTATQRISIGACLLGGAVIIWHVLEG